MSVSSLKNKIPLVFAAALVAGCQSDEETPPPKPRPVITFTVPEASSGSTRRFSGETVASQSVDLGFQLAGRIQTLTAEKGKRYAKGTILAQLDPATVKADLRNAEAQALQAVQALRRTQELLESGNASQAEFDSAIANQKAADAKLESARLALQYTNLEMPYDGVIADIPADVNQVVSAGTPVIAIQGDRGMDFEIGITTSMISRIKEGQEVKLSLNDLGSVEVPGVVTKISPIASQNTTYPVTISIKDPEKIENLRSGLDGEAIFSFDSQSGAGVSIPSTAVLASADGSNYIWLVETPDQPTSAVNRHEVTVKGLTTGGTIKITQGLDAGQVIVTKGVGSLTPGMIVTIPQG
ncbi:MAG: efflux RND transporter periplasmic adaptor subunit [Akkermansiaceae bacterium]|jgi:RND family efflux transporter MFP subunit